MLLPEAAAHNIPVWQLFWGDPLPAIAPESLKHVQPKKEPRAVSPGVGETAPDHIMSGRSQDDSRHESARAEPGLVDTVLQPAPRFLASERDGQDHSAALPVEDVLLQMPVSTW